MTAAHKPGAPMTPWSSRCESGNCIETREVNGGFVEIRDTANPTRVLSVLAEAWEARDAALRAEGRQQAADAIVAHRDKFFAGEPDNEARARIRRHLDIAARVAAPPITLPEAARAFADALEPHLAAVRDDTKESR